MRFSVEPQSPVMTFTALGRFMPWTLNPSSSTRFVKRSGSGNLRRVDEHPRPASNSPFPPSLATSAAGPRMSSGAAAPVRELHLPIWNGVRVYPGVQVCQLVEDATADHDPRRPGRRAALAASLRVGGAPCPDPAGAASAVLR